MQVVTFNITTDASGDYDSTADGGVTGALGTQGPYYLVGVEWIDGGLADGVDATLSVTSTPSGVDKTLLTLTDANNDGWYYPKVLAQGNTGADLTAEYTWQIFFGTLKVVVASGGNAATGKLIAYVLDV